MNMIPTTLTALGLVTLLSGAAAAAPAPGYNTEVPSGILTPDTVDTSIGKLKFADGVPTEATVERVYDFLDTSRAADTFLKGMPAASLHALIKGAHSLGAVQANEVIILDKLMDSTPFFLTANSATMYVVPDLDLKRDGPTVVDVPKGLLGAANDAYFRFINNLPEGKYLYLPPGYQGDVPEGYTVLEPNSYRVWVFLRLTPRGDLAEAADFIKGNLKVYPLSQAGSPPEMKWISASGKEFNTIHTNDVTFFDHLNEVVQYEALETFPPEVRGLFASLGMEKGKPFEPDERMRARLKDGVAIGNAASRAIVWYPRYDLNMQGVRIYPDTNSAWMRAYTDQNVFFNGRDGRTMNTDARVTFHYPYTAVTPAMAKPRLGTGSDYGIAFLDSNKKPFVGSATYRLRLPADAPVANFWAVTLYDPQTRSMLQTPQMNPSIDSIKNSPVLNDDGSVDLYFGPRAPAGKEQNWIQTVPGKGWFTILRMYGPLEGWIDQSWRPSEIERMP